MEAYNIGTVTIFRNIKSKDYWIQVISLFVIGIFLIFQFKSNQLAQINKEASVFFTYLVIIFSISFFSMISMTLNSSLSITEKATKRMEYYLANGVSIYDLFKGYTISTFILSILPTYIIMFIMIAIFKDVVTNDIFLYLFLIYPIFCVIYVGFMNIIIFSMKNLIMIRNLLSMLNFAILYMGGMLSNHVTNLAIKYNISLIMVSNIGILAILAILLISSISFYKKLNNETIIQSTQ